LFVLSMHRSMWKGLLLLTGLVLLLGSGCSGVMAAKGIPLQLPIPTEVANNQPMPILTRR
jgi:hypothetical protein